MLFDSTLLFFHTGSLYNFTSGEFVNLAGTTANSASSVINLGNARDLGIGPGAEVPKVEVLFGTAVTAASASQTYTIQFQGSTDSSTWTTYIETGYATSASFAAGSGYRFDVPRRPPGAALPLYYRLNVVVLGAGASSAVAISTGTILSGIVLEAAESAGTLDQYASGFSVS